MWIAAIPATNFQHIHAFNKSEQHSVIETWNFKVKASSESLNMEIFRHRYYWKTTLGKIRWRCFCFDAYMQQVMSNKFRQRISSRTSVILLWFAVKTEHQRSVNVARSSTHSDQTRIKEVVRGRIKKHGKAIATPAALTSKRVGNTKRNYRLTMRIKTNPPLVTESYNKWNP